MKQITLFLCFLAIFSSPIPVHAKKSDPLENQLKLWSFKAVTELMTFNHDNLESRLKKNKKYLSKIACKRYLWILRIYDISDGAKEREETVITRKLWRRYVVPNELDLIFVDKVRKDQLRERNEDSNAMIWLVKVPVYVEFHKGKKNKRYKFLAILEVRMDGNPARFQITSWHKNERPGSMDIERTIKFNASKYKECNALY